MRTEKYFRCPQAGRLFLTSLAIILSLHTEASAQRCTMSGIVVEKDGTPVEAAVVLLPESNLWGVTSGSGNLGRGLY